MAYRQTNHNGRVSTKSGSVYNRNHNDRSFDISHAENVHPDMVSENIIIHYDETNHPHVIDIKDKSHTTIAYMSLYLLKASANSMPAMKLRVILNVINP